MKRAVLFDLDGTLVDTAPDMVDALDRLRAENGLAPVDYAFARSHVSRGADGLVRAGFPEVEDEATREALRRRFLDLYAANLCERSAPFPGLIPVLQRLEALAGAGWGVVTNKPEWLARPLLEALDLLPRLACLVCGDSLARRKPHPDPLLHAAATLGLSPQRCVYVGDDQRDVVAARAARMDVVAAAWGYIGPGESAAAWQADFLARTPAHLLEWLERHGWLDADHH